MPTLRATLNGKTVERPITQSPMTIGRQPGLAFTIPAKGASREHLRIGRLKDGGWAIKDLGSTNGTLLNGAQLKGAIALSDGDKIVIGQTVIKFDMVDETEVTYHEQVERLVSTDDLTGMVVKRRFDAHLSEAIRVAHASGRPLCGMMMDMDGLKAINDRHGHHVGANTISQVGVLIKGLLQNRGEACRFGGDEFSAFVPACDKTLAMMIAEQIRQTVEGQTYVVGPVQVRATISIGVALLSPDGDLQSLIEAADQALYRAKAKGRNVTSD